MFCDDAGAPINIDDTTGGMYVMTTEGDIYVRIEDPPGTGFGQFHQSSFLEGKPVGAAGTILIDNGQVTYVTRHSGHYYPQAEQLAAFLDELALRGADLSKAKVVR